MKRAFVILLKFYPYDFRAAFAAEMLAAFEETGAGWREFPGLAAGAAREWIAKWTSDKYVRGRALPDVRMMRPAGISKEVWFARCSPDI